MSSMLDMPTLGEEVAAARRRAGLTQSALAQRAGLSRATLAALEGGHLAELGIAKVGRLLAALGLTLRIAPDNAGRPTLDELRAENEAADADDRAGRRR